ncbi:MAG: hypothetical protein RJA70_4309 [Pseudomonadota bacterium]|jgi:putative oxidoreductase
MHHRLAPYTEQTYALLRLGSGFLFAIHGVQKVFGLFADAPKAVGSQLWLGGVLELVCGLAIALGFKTPWNAFLASGTMAVAYTQFHWKLQLGEQLLPAINKGELALVYALLFLFVACKGSGAFSIDAWRGAAR